MIMLWGK